jgi:hypothetical protein
MIDRRFPERCQQQKPHPLARKSISLLGDDYKQSANGPAALETIGQSKVQANQVLAICHNVSSQKKWWSTN